MENSLVASQGPVNNINQTQMASGIGAGVGISNDPTREQSKDVFSNSGQRSGQISRRLGNMLNESSEVSSQMHISFRPSTPLNHVANIEDRNETEDIKVYEQQPEVPLTKV
jgi:hypothetical protein